MDAHGPEILTALAIAGILALFRIAFVVQRLDQAVRGINGDNGLVGDVKELRKSRHEQGDKMHTILGYMEAVKDQNHDLLTALGTRAREARS